MPARRPVYLLPQRLIAMVVILLMLVPSLPATAAQSRPASGLTLAPIGATVGSGSAAPEPLGLHPRPYLPRVQLQQGCPQCPTTTLQVAMLIDGSGSIDASEFQLELQGMAAAIAGVTTDGSVEVTAVQFGSGVTVQVPPTVIDSIAVRDTLTATVLAIAKTGGTTNMAGAVNTAVAQITGSPRFGCAAYQVINLATDGVADDTAATTTARGAAIAAGIDEIDIEAIGNGVNLTFLNTLAYPQPAKSPPAAGFVQQFNNFSTFAVALSGAASRLLENVPTDLEIEKHLVAPASPAPVAIAGQDELFYQIRVVNNGPGDAYNVVVTDTLPAESTFVADSEAVCTVSGVGQVVCALDRLDCGSAFSDTLKVRVNHDAVANHGDYFSVRNAAEVSARNAETDPLDNISESEAAFVQDAADLQITKISEPHGVVRAGQIFTYTIFVDNLGPSVSRNVVIIDTLLNSSQVSIQSCAFSTSQGGGSITQFSCSTGAVVSTQFGSDIGTFSTNRLDPLTPLSQGRLRASFRLTALEPLDVMNTTRVTADTPDPDMSNNLATDSISVEAIADLALTKTGTPEPVVAGNSLTYTLTVNNNGPSTAQNVVIQDNLPAEVEVVSLASSAGTCNAGTPGDASLPATCALGTLPVGASRTMNVVVRVRPDAVTDPVTNQKIIHNDARASSGTFDPDSGNNLATAATTVNAQADLLLRKFAVGTPVAGEIIHYEYQVSNLGPSVSRDVTLRDFLPSQVDVVSAFVDVEGGTGGLPLACNVVPASNVLFCPLGDIQPAGSTPIFVFVNVRIKSDTPAADITNSADVNLHSTPDPNTSNNNASVSVTVRTQADLQIEKSSEPAKVNAAEQIKYTLTVHNSGPSDAQNVIVTDTLPVGVKYEVDTDHCVVTGAVSQIVTCTNSLLPANDTWQFDISARVDPDIPAGTELVNQACVAGQTTLGDPNPGNNCATANNLVLSKADLKITKVSAPNTAVRAGELFTYTLFVDNLGPSYARGVQVSDDILSSGAFIIDRIITDTARNNTCAVVGTTRVDCQLQTALEPVGEAPPSGGQSGRWVIQVSVRADQTQGVNNVARVFTGPISGYFESGSLDPDMSNNQAQAFLSVTDVADLALTKTGTPDTVVAGNPLTYTLTVTNSGPSTAENVVIEDNLPVEVQVVSMASSAGACSAGTPGDASAPTTCALGTLPVGASRTMTLVVRVRTDALTDPGTNQKILHNSARAFSDTFDPDTGNNLGRAETVMEGSAHLSVQKFGNQNPIPAGEQTSYDILFRNEGPSTARQVVLTDVLPRGFQALAAFVVDGSPDEGSARCFLRTGDPVLADSATCELGDLPAGQTGRIVVEALVRSGVPAGAVINSATISSVTPDPSPSPASTFQTTVSTQADLQIEKSSEPAKVNAAEQIRYTLTVHNNGPSDAQNVIVTDTLPVGVKYEVDTDHCVVTGAVSQIVTCTNSLLPADDTWEFDISARVDPDIPAGSELVNQACVAGQTTLGDPNPGNDCATANNLVLGNADLMITKSGQPAGEVPAGQTLTYTVMVENLGPGYAASVVVTDLLQSTGNFDVVSVAGDRPATCSPTSGTFAGDLQLECALTDMLEPVSPGTSGRWILTVVIRGNEAQDVRNTARVIGAGGDPDLSNNQAAVQHRIAAVANLAVTQSDDPDPLYAGSQLTYTIHITNNGPSTAENVVVRDNLPAEVRVTAVSRSDLKSLLAAAPLEKDVVEKVVSLNGIGPLGAASCLPGTPGNSSDPTTCHFGTLAPGAVATMTLVVNVRPDVIPEGATAIVILNGVAVASDTFDPDETDNSWVEDTRVLQGTVLSIHKQAVREVIHRGDQIDYTIYVTNTGPGTALSVGLIDGLIDPKRELTLVQASVSGGCTHCGSCQYLDFDFDNPLVLCELGDLPVGSTRRILLKFDADPNMFCGISYTNTITLDPLVNPNIVIDPASQVSETVSFPGCNNKVYLPIVSKEE